MYPPFLVISKLGFKHGSNTNTSHLSFANDMVIFFNKIEKFHPTTVSCLEQYESISSQLVNMENIGLILRCRVYSILIR